MTFLKKIATINLNSIKTEVNKSLLRDFVQNEDLDFVFLQEVLFEDFSFLGSYRAFVNISELDKGTAILVRRNQGFRNIIYDPSGRILSIVCDDVNFVNVYAHSGTNKKRERDDLFRDEITPHVIKGNCSHTVIGGDFNCVLNKRDSRSATANLCQGLKDLTTSMQLKDVASVRNGSNVEFTFHRAGSASRLDRFYVSAQFLEKVVDVRTVPVAFSDHSAVVMKFSVDQSALCQRGRGYWKLNSSLLNKDDISCRYVVDFYQLKDRESYTRNRSTWWNTVVKPKTQFFFKNESRIFNCRLNSAKSELYARMYELAAERQSGVDNKNQLQEVKSELMRMELDRLKFYGSRFPQTSMLEGEKMSVFHVSNQMHKTNDGAQFQLRDGSDLVTDSGRLKKKIEDFFTRTFRAEDSACSESTAEALRDVTNSLDQQQQQDLTRPIDEAELKAVVADAAKKKSPGPDGLSYEFYSVYFEMLKNDLLELFNRYLDGTLKPPKEFTAGIITLIPKVSKAEDLNEFRPISMLNTDYKLFTKILANRLHAVVGSLLGPGQVACTDNQSCTTNLVDLRAIIAKAAESKRFKGFLLSVDLEKAFDKVNHVFLWKTLGKFGIPERFINCIKNLYASATSRIIFNGILTSDVKIGSSVRQGCPLSMVLFVLYIEGLVRKISANIRGVLLSGKFIRVLAYADDLVIFIRDDAEFDLVLQIINSFAEASCIRLNRAKSAFLRINNAKSGPQQLREADEIKILGVVFTEKWSTIVKRNFDKLLGDIQFRLSKHRTRNLNLIERTWLLNVFVLSKLWYICQVFPPDNVHIAKLRKIAGQFIWGSRQIFKVERKQLYLDYEQGGIKLVDPEAKAKALFIKTVLYGTGKDQIEDTTLLNFSKKQALSRNTREWLDLALSLKPNPTSTSVQTLYRHFVNENRTTPKVEQHFPAVDWHQLWENLGHGFLSSESRSQMFLLYNDLVVSKEKLFKYNIGRLTDDLCEWCGVPESNEHKIKHCVRSKEIWSWLEETLTDRLGICGDPEDVLSRQINERNRKEKAALWLTMFVMSYVVKKYPNTSLYCVQKGIRDSRWNNRNYFRQCFGNELNVC